MKLCKVDDQNWINVGDGSIPSVVDVSSYERSRCLVNFVGGGQLVLGSRGENVVKALENDGGFGR